METTYSFEDVLTGATVACGYPYLQSHYVKKSAGAIPCESVFFPGCSFINYGLPLVQAVYNTLSQAGSVQGISLLCCGKILSYEAGGDELRAHFEQQFRDHLKATGVKRLVAACPNCVVALRTACAADPATKDIQVVALPQELARLGYRIDPGVAQNVAALGYSEGASPDNVVFCPHDSCPDREMGEFAEGMRLLAENLPVVEAAHHGRKSVCCGSLPRAAGKFDAADKCAQLCGSESVAAGASAIITPCVSCSFQLTMAQHEVPVFHYLELLYNWRIDWARADRYMKLRFLFDDVPHKEGTQASTRAFVALGGAADAASSGNAADVASAGSAADTDAGDAAVGAAAAEAEAGATSATGNE